MSFPKSLKRTATIFATVLQNLPNVILTPHIGGSTEEAQANIGLDVTSKLIKYLELGTAKARTRSRRSICRRRPERTASCTSTKTFPGVLGEINSRLSDHGINILGQYLKTNETIGYVILDVDSKISKEAFELLKDIDGTVKARMVY